MLKRILLVFLFAVVIGTNVSAESMLLQISHGAVFPGEEIEINAVISGNPGIIAYQMDIVYDDTMLDPQGVTRVSGTQQLLSHTIVLDGDIHCIRIAYADTVSSNDNGTLFTIRFKADKDMGSGQQADISIINCQFFDSEGGVVPVAIVNGYVKARQSSESGEHSNSQPISSSRELSSSQTVSYAEESSGQSTNSGFSASKSSTSSSNETSPDWHQRIPCAAMLMMLAAILIMIIRKKTKSTGSRLQ